MRPFGYACCAALGTLLGVSAAGGQPCNNLLTNGDFETGTFAGWTLFGNIGNTGVVSAPIGCSGLPVEGGTYAAAFGAVGSTGGIFQQVVPVAAGTRVRIAFAYAMDARTPNFFSEEFDGTVHFTYTDDLAHAIGWSHYTITTTTSTANPVLRFTVRNDPCWGFLDSVSVCVIETACCDPVTGVCVVAIDASACPTGMSAASPLTSTCSPSPCPFPGAAVTCGDCWYNGAFNGTTGQASHLGGALPNGAKAADDFYLVEGFVYDLKTFTATLLTTTTPGLVRPKAEIWSECNGCPGQLLYTFDNPVVVETGLIAGPAFDGRPLRIVHATFDVSREAVMANRNVVLHGGNYWLSVYGRSDGLGPTMQMYDVTYWGTTTGFGGGVQGQPAYKIDGLPTPNYNQFSFPAGCGPNAWHSVVDDCCVGCTDLNFQFCTTACKVLVDNGTARRQVALEPVGSTSEFAPASFSAAETRSADDFVLPGCENFRICYVEACILTNCPTFDGVFEVYANDCDKPSYALHGVPLAGQFVATKIIPLGFNALMDGRTVTAYKLEFHDLPLTLAGGRQYWISAGVRYTFSITERAYFCYNADCARTCLIRWNQGRVLTATTLDDYSRIHGCNSPVLCNGWAKVASDFSFLIAGDGLTTPGPIVSTPSCAADFNRDGSLNVSDVFDYLSAWFDGCP
jgi:hypothetical protein